MSDNVSGQTARSAELTYDPGYHALLERLRSHGRQSTASSALDVKPDELLTIGELARATGVATSALRYWEELGLLPAPTRVSGQRRYPASAMAIVGLILSLQDIGFSLRELKGLITSRYEDADAWRELHQRKLAELDERIARAQAARTAIAHGLACWHPEGIFHCPTFARVIAARLAGSPLHEAHTH
ncbi:MerR family transcriptional regulator [Nonomuraea angiospora]|uniref:MerR family transcriptional regulator n=1 Tax=Nonomuraea angiospora TaxID=46172 RepID=UPI0029B9FA81|nr:MerR family transcriptional regulator [Nonomuraea angiospora]MDX3101825.1 MerR family DNA-binding transcriptional regulator [Nonomuraea angiospora]